MGLILEEMQQHSNEEFFIRRFFSLLESEVDREGIQAQLLELRYDKKNKYSDYAKLFAACWLVIHILSGQGALLFIKFMPHIHSIRGSDKVEIDYIEKKHVKKPNGAKPGFVVYYTNYSLVIDSDISNIKVVQD